MTCQRNQHAFDQHAFDQHAFDKMGVLAFALVLFAGSTATAQDESADDQVEVDSTITSSSSSTSDGDVGDTGSVASVGSADDPFVSGDGSSGEASLFSESSSGDEERGSGGSDVPSTDELGAAEPAVRARGKDEGADDTDEAGENADTDTESSFDPASEARELGVTSSGRDGGSVDESSVAAEDVETDSLETDGPRADLGADTERKLVERVVRSNRDDIQSCYTEAVETNPDLAGSVEVEFVVQPNGQVGEARVVESTVDHEPLAECVKREVAQSTYPRPKSRRATTWSFPFAFK